MDDLAAGDTTGIRAQPSTARGMLMLGSFTAAIFVSAALLFLVQPMFAKMVLPRLGGAPAVWSVAIVFFQAALLAGYAYAHLLTRWAPPRSSVLVHVAVLLAACLALPLAIAEGWGRPPPAGEPFWLLGLFAASIGLPFFALAANSPLLQAWFARTGHPAAGDPYFLYAASNLGSFLALLAYPLAVEPLVRLGAQTRFWSIGFYLLIALIAGCGALVWHSPRRPAAVADGAAEPCRRPAAPSWSDAGWWMLLAGVPAGLLVAVTAHISTDVAAVPLLWVLPLALYLLTFVIVFQRRRLVPHRLVVAIQPLCVVGLMAVMIFDPIRNIVGQIAVHVGVFFVCALVCHGELARRRPPARDLTAFYLWMSAGGTLGGVAAGLAAPYAFNWIAEYPILLALAVLCRPGRLLPADWRWRSAVLATAGLSALLLVLCVLHPVVLEESIFDRTVAALLVACLLCVRAPLAFAALVGFVLIANHSIVEEPAAIHERSFFGVAKVSETPDGQYRLLQHGTTYHGGQHIRDADGEPIGGRPELLMYYWDGSAIAQTFDAARAATGGAISYAVIGLGTGSLACRAEPEDTVDYYEIDPAIIRIARDPTRFSFLAACRPEVPIILGDARLTLADAPDGSYDLIVVDAFSSDAIPIHLLTREAMAIYLKKLAPHGIVAMHVSNRHLELASVVAGIAAANGAVTRVNDSAAIDEASNPYKYSGTVAAVARSDEDFGPLAEDSAWETQAPDPGQWVWTDDYCNIVGAVIRRLRE
jgi:hypothetical protein